jgi:hypothetical protein
MFILPHRIQQWREERQRTKEKEVREAEWRAQREKRDDEQARALHLTLCELQRAIDPLIATQIYNTHFCPLISRLPKELLLCIFDFLCDDLVALRCLRIVSKTFFQLLNSRTTVWNKASPIRDNIYGLHSVPSHEFRRLLQRDGRCSNCKRWNIKHGFWMYDDCKFQQTLGLKPSRAPEYRRWHMLDCDVCQSRHDIHQFPYPYQGRCLGQLGSVQLCEHYQITWGTIKAHIEHWRQQQQFRRGDWEAWIDNFNIECHDASHDTCCTVSEAPTWPRARLGTSMYKPGFVSLILEWKPHSRMDAFSLTADGQIRVTELRAMFQKLRSLGPADDLWPAAYLGALPEMAFFSSSSCNGRFVYYKTGEDDKVGPPPELSPPLPPASSLSTAHHHEQVWRGKKLDIRPHYRKDTSGTTLSSQCLVVSYKKDILVCSIAAMMDHTSRLVPTDHWLHAMDTRTYPHPRVSHIRPECRVVACVNYYRRRKDLYSCDYWHYSQLIHT